ncbi:055L [Cherax quadricarinatus iridovirus]|uniref:dTMP kinase n=1 Tax=Shrimp hemocyte iridescent virus TaxID=2039780 RepID=A0A291B0T3_9VIRU|nr:055L [Cherax quadricarinatus iridovirus]YP_010084848.1 thymidylate kinase [Shrimp hemocyte iridescent virus]UPA43373.1 thymidylate kinase [Iridovirus CN01]ASZ85035.1 055L [Cherax quadricarinatus iridovirus]ATE87105.1 thymidylate kinase [Shrimp hemocyte iridescent virus]UPA43449.1 thymidylate kinase [Iridovirus CN01]UPA43643.1 thymidylate kinase [Iridovirus CN01]
MLVVFEGCDKSGKSTQTKLLVSSVKSPLYGGEYFHFPDRTTEIGKLIDRYLKKEIEIDDHAVHLLFSANRWELNKKIRELLGLGKHVVLDRYHYSGLVFSLARGVDTYEWCSACDVGLPEPDVVFFMKMDAMKNLTRSGFGTERYETNSIQDRVNLLFRDLADKNGWVKIDADDSIENVHEKIVNVVKRYIE